MDSSVLDPLIAKQFARLKVLCLALWMVSAGIVLLYFIFNMARAKGWL